MTEAPGSIHSAEVLQFPPCHSLELVAISERIMFGVFPTLTRFIRPVTSAERAAGITSGHESVLVTKAKGRIGRTYGQSILLN